MHLLLFLSCLGIAQCLRLEAEPRCSRFHYEEQVLEKMIRLEVKVEEIQKRITQTNQNVLDVLEDLKTERDSMKNDNIPLQRNFSKEMEKRITDISELKATMLTDTIVFKARGPADKSLEGGQTIIFKDIMLNKGEAYDSSTGIFTASVSGTYMFMIHLCVNNLKSMYYGIMVDDTVVTSGRFYGKSADTCYTADAVLVLNGDEKVYVKCLSGVSGEVLYEYSSSTNNYWITFSGLLVHR